MKYRHKILYLLLSLTVWIAVPSSRMDAHQAQLFNEKVPEDSVKLVNYTDKDDLTVVTALGINRKVETLGYAVQEVSSDKITTVKDANFVNSLSGKVAGMNINALSSGHGGAVRVVMRGLKSIIKSNRALYAIDGVLVFNPGIDVGATSENSMNAMYFDEDGISDLNPEDIASVSVLSGPAASALYGSAAANGVILITTKKGESGKIKVRFSNNTTFSNPLRIPEFQTEYGNRPGEFMSWGVQGTGLEYNPSDFFRTGSNVNNSLAVSIGNAKNQTYLSVSTNNSSGILPNNNYNRYNFTFRNTTHFLNDKMTLDVSGNYIIQNQKNMVSHGSSFNPLEMVYLWPRGENFNEVKIYKEWDESRDIYVQKWEWQGAFSSSTENPYWEMYEKLRSSKKHRYIINAGLSYRILDWLSVAARARLDNTIKMSENKYSASTDTYWTSGSKNGYYARNRDYFRQTYADLMVNIDKSWEQWYFSSNIGGSLFYVHDSANGYSGGLAMVPNVFNAYNIDRNSGTPSQLDYKKSEFAAFANAQVGFRSMLFLTLTARNEWLYTLENTSRLSCFFPSVGLSAVISQMAEMPSWIELLKVRASWAEAGSPLQLCLAGAPVGGTLPDYRYLTYLYPQTTSSWEAGLDFRFLKHFNFDLTWYLSDTKNQLLTVNTSVPPVGDSGMDFSRGHVRNWGFEAIFGYNAGWNGFSWDGNIIFSANRNRIMELLDDYYNPDTDTHLSIVGLNMGINYLTKGGSMGDVYSTREFARDPNGYIAIDPVTGNVMTADLRDKPLKLGSVLPDANLGWSNSFSWKGINLDILFTARIGGIAISPTQSFLDCYGVSKASADARKAGGIRVNRGLIDAEGYYRVAKDVLSEYTYDATTVRLQELSLGYTFPSKWFKDKMSLRVSLIGRNLWLIYCKAPFDPETTASTGTYNQGYDYFMSPSLRNVGFSVNIEF